MKLNLLSYCLLLCSIACFTIIACNSDMPSSTTKQDTPLSAQTPIKKASSFPVGSPTLPASGIGKTVELMTPSFEEIRKKRKESSYQEWKQYTANLRGTHIEGWRGQIYQVAISTNIDPYQLFIWLDSPDSLKYTEGQGPDMELWFTHKDNQQWQEGQQVVITGTVASVSDTSLGTIDLVDPQVDVITH